MSDLTKFTVADRTLKENSMRQQETSTHTERSGAQPRKKSSIAPPSEMVRPLEQKMFILSLETAPKPQEKWPVSKKASSSQADWERSLRKPRNQVVTPLGETPKAERKRSELLEITERSPMNQVVTPFGETPKPERKRSELLEITERSNRLPQLDHETCQRSLKFLPGQGKENQQTDIASTCSEKVDVMSKLKKLYDNPLYDEVDFIPEGGVYPLHDKLHYPATAEYSMRGNPLYRKWSWIPVSLPRFMPNADHVAYTSLIQVDSR
ncbi:hypothetical protein R1sor_023689 [Riccia sorocarpa]|uniref:Uncharacterized protein n=1 Tax=Riccia sorocarpa TaxID=122646 RepID=A0ABD3GND0_9MARC